MAFSLGLIGPGLKGLEPVFCQVFQQLRTRAPPQLKQHEGVFTEAFSHQEVHRTDVFAGIGFIRTAAFTAHLLQLEGEEPAATGRKGSFDVRRHDSGQELCRPAGLLCQGFQHEAPVLIAENIQPELHFVGVFIGSLNTGMHSSPFKANRCHVSFTGVGPGPFEAFFEAVGVDQLHPLFNPPGLLPESLVTQ